MCPDYFPSASGHSFKAVNARQPDQWAQLGYSFKTMLSPPQDSTLSKPNSPSSEVEDILSRLHSGKLWVISSRHRNGLIIHKRFYTEFAGPGAAVGGFFDADCLDVIPLGKLKLMKPGSPEEQQKALRIRLQWVRLTQNFTDKPVALERAQMILEQFKSYFDHEIVDQVPNEAFAMLVGVLPETLERARKIV